MRHERVQGVHGPPSDMDRLFVGWVMDVTPMAVSITFPPSHWTKIPHGQEHEITGLCDALASTLRRVLKDNA